MSEKIPISVVIITYNEQDRIADCLASLDWVDEIIVVDDESTDETVRIAARFTDKVFQKKMEVEGAHRNYAYSLARNEWVLSLDADERVTSELVEKIAEAIKNPEDCDGFTIQRRNFIGDYWLRYGGQYPSAQLKFFKKDKFKYEEVDVHPRAFMQGKCGHIKADIIHYTYRNFTDFFAKLNNQTSREAKKWFNEKRKIGLRKALRKTADRFLKAYILKKGYRDGFYGFISAAGSGLYQLMSYAKYWEMLLRHKGIGEDKNVTT